MLQSTSETVIDLRVIRASDLPSQWPASLSVYVLVLPGGEQLYRTETIIGPEPRWDKTFFIRVPGPSARIKLQVCHSTDSSNSTLLGETEVSVDELLRSEGEEVKYKLTKPGFKIRQNRGKIFISAQVHVDVQDELQLQSTTQASQNPTGSSGIDAPRAISSHAALGTTIDFLRHISHDSLPRLTSDLAEDVEKTGSSVDAMSTPRWLQHAPGIINAAASSGGDAIDIVNDVISGILHAVQNVGDTFAEVHPFAKLAWTVVSGGYQILKDQVSRDDKIRALWKTALDILTFIQTLEGGLLTGRYLTYAAIAVMKQIYECCQFLRKYAARRFLPRAFHAMVTSKADDRIQEFSDAFIDLKERLSRGLSVEIWNGTRAIGNDLEAMKNTYQEIYLYMFTFGNIPIAECDTRRGCLPGTRDRLIDYIVEWIHDFSRGQLLWLSGAIGTGKSSVANTVVGLLKGLGRLGANCRFDRQVDPSAIFRHVAYQLALVDSHLRERLYSAFRSNRNIASAPLLDQALRIIVEPLGGMDLVGPVVLVFDALDEIAHRDRVIQEDILAFFSDDEFTLPDWIKVVITSRYTDPIRSRLKLVKDVELLSIDDYNGTSEDIYYFVKHRLQEIAKRDKLPAGWLPEGAARSLTDRAEGQFQWASLTCDFIAGNPLSRLSSILSLHSTMHDGLYSLDHLYNTVLEDAYSARNRNPAFIVEFGYVIGAVAAARTCFHLVDLNDFLGLRSDQYTSITLPGKPSFSMEGVDQIINSVRCLFHIPVAVEPQVAGGLRFAHSSIFEYLTDPTRCSRFHIDLPYWNLILAIQCLRTLNHRLDEESPALEPGVQQVLAISAGLRYSCQFFLQHVTDCGDHEHETLVSEMDMFISEMLVKWAKTMVRLELEWKDILRDLIRWYEVPRWQYQPLLAINMVDKVAWMTTSFQNDLENLESSVVRRAVAPVDGLDVLDDAEEPRMPGAWAFHIGRILEVQNTVVPTVWNSWDVPRPERWFEQYIPEMEHEEYEAARQDIENTLVEVLNNIPVLPARSGVTHRLDDFVAAARLLAQIWIYAGDNKHYPKECTLLAHRCSQVLLTTHRAILQGPLYSPSLSYIVEQIVDGLRRSEKFLKSLSLMRVYQAAVSYDPIERNIRNVNKDLSSIVDMFTITSSFGLNLRERLELGGFNASETEVMEDYTMLRSAIDTAELPSWVASHTQIKTEKQIARGLSGLIFKGIYKGKTVAIKLLNDRSMPRETFSRIVNIWRSLLHVNIVPFIGASDPQRSPPRFLISPYCEYEDLITHLKGNTDFQFATLLDMARDVAEGMRYLHGQDIVHRDLQGANVLVTAEGACKIAGFTYSVVMNMDHSEIPRLPLPAETVQWLAPEVLRDPSTVNPDVDIYSFAMTCVEILTGGDSPWPGLSTEAVKCLVLAQNRRPRLSSMLPIASVIRSIIEACWSKDPAARPGFPRILDEVRSAGLKLRFREPKAQVGMLFYDSD